MKYIRFDGTRTYMFPNGQLATPEGLQRQFPAAFVFTHVMLTDDAEEVCFAVQNLSAMRTMKGIDAALTEDEAIAALTEIENTPPEDVPSPEERIAAALEYQNLLTMEDATA